MLYEEMDVMGIFKGFHFIVCQEHLNLAVDEESDG